MAALDYHGNALLLLKVSHLLNCADILFTNAYPKNAVCPVVTSFEHANPPENHFAIKYPLHLSLFGLEKREMKQLQMKLKLPHCKAHQ